MCGFIKLYRNEKTEWLISSYPNAFMLLTLIAYRARVFKDHPDGLMPGDCLIGDYSSCGLTRQQYRTALDILTRHNFVKIKETCRTRQKPTTGVTTKGTKVNICSLDVYDINIIDNNHQVNHWPTTDQPPTNHEQERTRKNKKDKNKNIPNAIASDLAFFFFQKIQEFKPDFPKPNLDLWTKGIDAMISVDKRDPEKIRAVMAWLPTNEFWRKNALSPLKLRKQFDRLELEKQQLPTKKLNGIPQFIHGQVYQGKNGLYECIIDEIGIGFLLQGSNFIKNLSRKEACFKEKLVEIISILGIAP